MIGTWWTRWRRRRIIQGATLDEALWARVMGRSLFRGLSADELRRLRDWAILFLHEKGFYGAHDFEVDEEMRLTIAAEACLPILNLDLDGYRGFHAIIVYPDAFHTTHTWHDEAGVVHSRRQWQGGESWERGPVLLAWPDVAPDYDDGVNLVIHEFAHKLDMQNGDADGHPPLHSGMSNAAWRQAMEAAYSDHCARVDRGMDTELDPYAAESPAEFFAVASEYYFCRPARMRAIYPAVYRQLALFYRRDPLVRDAATDNPTET